MRLRVSSVSIPPSRRARVLSSATTPKGIDTTH
jgi:hypothetical protein